MLTLLTALLGSIFLALRVSPSGSFPKPLSRAKEQELFTAMKSGDPSARSKLIEHNLRLVAHVVKKYYSSRDDQDDLISVGTIGLVKAVASFDCEKNIRFATYACRCVENEILMYFRSLKKQAQDVSLSEPIDRDKEGNELYLIDVIDSSEDMVEKIENSDRRRLLKKFLDSALSEREKEIIILRYGLMGKKALTQKETADRLGISRSYVSRIEAKALLKLRNEFEKGK